MRSLIWRRPVSYPALRHFISISLSSTGVPSISDDVESFDLLLLDLCSSTSLNILSISLLNRALCSSRPQHSDQRSACTKWVLSMFSVLAMFLSFWIWWLVSLSSDVERMVWLNLVSYLLYIYLVGFLG